MHVSLGIIHIPTDHHYQLVYLTLVLSKCTSLSTILDHFNSVLASYFSKIIGSSLRVSYTILKNSFTPAVVNCSADTAGPMSLHFAYLVTWFGFSSLLNIVVLNSIRQGHSEQDLSIIS